VSAIYEVRRVGPTGKVLKLATRDAFGAGKPRIFPVTEKRNAEGSVTNPVSVRRFRRASQWSGHALKARTFSSFSTTF
jgi:hypothetical protein